MNLVSERSRLLWICFTAGIVVFPLLVHGPSYGHDFDFHLLNWMEAARQFGHGTLLPRWAYSPAYGAGEPRFVFYPPLSWILGALLGLLLTHIPGLSSESAWTVVPILYTWICLTLSGITMYSLARMFARPYAALAGSVLYLVNPYMLFTAYERAAYAELLAAAWMPLLLGAMLRPRLQPSRIALVMALLWLTNVPAAVVGSYALAVIAVLLVLFPSEKRRSLGLLSQRETAIVWPTAFGVLLGLGLASFYFVPAAWERRFVQVSMAMIADMRVDHNFLFAYNGSSPDSVAHDAVLRTASWIAVALLNAAAALLLGCCIYQRRQGFDAGGTARLPAWPLLCLVALVGFLLTPASNLVWRHGPELAFLQFPWRLLMIIAPVCAVGIATALSYTHLHGWTIPAAAGALAVLLTAISYPDFHQVNDPDESVTARLHAFQQNKGADPTDEYTPESADNDALKPGNPAYWLARDPSSHPPFSPTAITPHHLRLSSADEQYLILNLRDYPAWQIEMNGRLVTERTHREDGLIALWLHPGIAVVDIRYRRMPDEIAGDLLTGGSVVLLGLIRIRERARDGSSSATTT